MIKIIGIVALVSLISILSLLCLGLFLFMVWMLSRFDGTWTEWTGGRKT